MFKMITNGYLVECGSCGNEEIAKTVREAKSVFEFHECSDTPNKIGDYTLVKVEKTFGYNPMVLGSNRL